MAQANNYSTGNNPTAAGGPVAVATLMQHPQVNYMQHQPFANQQLQQHQQQQQQQQQQQAQQQPPPQQFIPGPFYTLQQQQAFAQARLAAAAQAQQQQLQQQQQAAPQMQPQQQQQQAAPQAQVQPQQQQTTPGIYDTYSVVGHHHQRPYQQQQQQPQPTNPNAAAGGPHSTSSVPALPMLNYNNGVLPAAAATEAVAGVTTAVIAAATTGKKRKASPEVKSSTTKKKTPSPITKPKPKTKAMAKKNIEARNPSPPLPSPSPAELATTSGMSATAAKLIQMALAESNNCDIPAASTSPPPASLGDTHHHGRPLTAAEKKKSSRDRNREHARCTRLRKKAYVNKLKELVDGLHAERSEDARMRRVAVQHLAEIQELRRKVVHTFLGYHSGYEKDARRWETILERDFWLKQPVTPYRSFRRCEIQKGSRILKGVDAVIRDSASMSVMIETIGSRNLRWMQHKRDDFLTRDASKHCGAQDNCRDIGKLTVHRGMRQNTRLQHAISSMSSSSGSSTRNGTGSEEERRLAQRRKTQEQLGHHNNVTEEKEQHASSTDGTAKKVSSPSSNDTHQLLRNNPPSNDFHDYHAPSLLDPLPNSGDSVSSPSCDSLQGGVVLDGKHMCTDSSSGEEEKATSSSNDANLQKKRKMNDTAAATNQNSVASATLQVESSGLTVPMPSISNSLPPNIARSGGIFHTVKAVVQQAAVQPPPPAATTVASSSSVTTTASLPNGQANLSRAPATALPPFVGIGKRKHSPPTSQHSSASLSVENGNNNTQPMTTMSSSSSPGLPPVALHRGNSPSSNSHHSNNEEENNSNSYSASHHRGSGNIITIDNEYTTASSQSSSPSQNNAHLTQHPRGIHAHYHINEDDMILTDDILMCPFIFRSQEAVWCGALAECVQPGMLRATFSPTNKLKNVEMIFDAMGFCQQLERASGNEGMAQIIPNSLDMALATQLNSSDQLARVITLGKGPEFRIVSVNAAWTRVTGYTQLDVEGKDLRRVLLEGDKQQQRKEEEVHDFEMVVKKGASAASTNVHYDINGREFLNFMCSYPLSNLKDEVTHILHVCQKLPARA